MTALATLTSTFLAAVDIPLEWVVGLGLALFAVGILGVTCRRNILIMLLSIEIMLNAVNVVFVGFSRAHGDLSGQVFVFFSMTVAAAEVAVGLAIVIALYRLRRSTDVDDFHELGEVDYGPLPELQMEGEDHDHDHHEHDHDDHEASAPGAAPANVEAAAPVGGEA